MEKSAAAPALLVATPEYYHSNRAFGFWSLPDRSNAAKSAIEDQLASALAFYAHEVEQRAWYGFWDYGDMMRMYDEVRHQWRYDIGGWAWNNTELLPDYWLWYSFLRTGRADIFRLAEAMTRHTSEVDVHHIGRFAPLGSRHNVNHWGDGAKQPRVSQAGLKRFYFYLTADERVGDLLREQLKADFTYAEVKRTDARMPERGTYTTASFGTDWAGYTMNWLTEYERTGETKWLDKIKAGMRTQLQFASAPGGLLGAGPYDPATGQFIGAGRGGGAGRGVEDAGRGAESAGRGAGGAGRGAETAGRGRGRRPRTQRPNGLRPPVRRHREHGRTGAQHRLSRILEGLPRLCRHRHRPPAGLWRRRDPRRRARPQGLAVHRQTRLRRPLRLPHPVPHRGTARCSRRFERGSHPHRSRRRRATPDQSH